MLSLVETTTTLALDQARHRRIAPFQVPHRLVQFPPLDQRSTPSLRRCKRARAHNRTANIGMLAYPHIQTPAASDRDVPRRAEAGRGTTAPRGLRAGRGESVMGLVATTRGQMQGGATTAMWNTSSRSGNAAADLLSPQPFGRVGVAADGCVGPPRRCRSHRPRRPSLPSPARPSRQAHHTFTTAC